MVFILHAAARAGTMTTKSPRHPLLFMVAMLMAGRGDAGMARSRINRVLVIGLFSTP
jgi:hypothetical protein